MEVHKVLLPATKSAHGGSQSAASASSHRLLTRTKSAHGGSQSAAACHDICTWRFTKCCATCHEICTWRLHKVATKSQLPALQIAPRTKSAHGGCTKCCTCHDNLHMEVHKVYCNVCHEICTSRFTKCSAYLRHKSKSAHGGFRA